MRHAQRTLAAFAALTLLGVLALTVSELVPDERVVDQLVEARADGVLEDRNWPRDETGAIVDAFTDCVTLTIGTDLGTDAGFLTRVVEAGYLGDCEELDANLERYAANTSVERETYARYWHGSTILTRPLIGLFGLGTLRVVLSLIVIAGFGSLFSTIRGLFGGVAATVTLAPYVLTTNPLSLPQSTGQATATAVGLAGAALIARTARNGITADRIWMSSLLAGSAFTFFDILTIVPGIWLLGAALLLAVAITNGMRWIEAAGWALLSGVAWMVGFVGFWAMKWVVGAIVLGPSDIWDEVSSAVEQRIAGDDRVDPGPGDALIANLGEFAVRPLAVPGVLAVAGLVVWTLARSTNEERWLRIVLASPAAVPFLWYEFASNHSKIHDWFTYRSIPIALGVAAFAMLVPLARATDSERRTAEVISL